MSIITNGDFANGLAGWTVEQGGTTAPTASGGVVHFGQAGEVQNGDQLIQNVALVAGETYTLTFEMTAVSDAYGGYGINIQLEDVNDTSGFTDIGSATVDNGDTNTVTITFTSPYDSPDLIIRGQFGFGPNGGTSELILDNFVLTCFVRGTRISTPTGEVAVEDLAVGDLVNTVDGGPQPIRWIGSRVVRASEMHYRPEWAPVVIPAGALGKGSPSRDLFLSPCHRVLLSGPRLEMFLGESEGLVPVKLLIGLVEGVRSLAGSQLPTGDTEYFHILFDEHQIVVSEGIETESFHPAARTVSTFDDETKDEIISLFPEMEEDLDFACPAARRVIKAFEVPLLVDH